jgi:DNA (cytosine-5)-methyltransferase 1
LFAGVGGFDMGFDQSGYECLFQVERDMNCQAILRKHWPHVPKLSDVNDVLGGKVPAVDVIIFGSPCQDLSVAGGRAGLSGEKSVLFYEAMRIVKEMRDATRGEYPRAIVWENVAGALISNEGADFGAVLDEMAEAGALVVEWAMLDAKFFGVPQQRRRVFLIALLNPATAERCPPTLLPVSPSVPGNLTARRPERPEHLQAVDTSTQESRGQRNVTMTASGENFVNTITANIYHNRTVTSQDTHNGHLVIEYGESVAVRKLTPIECERLMGWPDDHTRWRDDGREQADSHRYQQCGNGVATPAARWVAQQIKPLLEND